MTRLRNEKREFNKNYISVIISSLVLLLLLVGFVFLLIYNPIVSNKTSDVSTDEPNFDAEIDIDGDDTVVDVGDSKCSKKNQNTILSDAKNVGVKLKTTEYVDYDDPINTGGFEDPDAPEEDYYTYDAFEISITNITKNLSVVVTDNCSSVSSNCEDGSWTFDGSEVENNTGSFVTIYVAKSLRYTVSIYSNIDECENELYRQFTVSTPSYNIYANTGACKDSDSSKCDLLTYDDVYPQDIEDDEDNNSTNSSTNDDNSSTSSEDNENSNIYIAVVAIIVIIIASICLVIYKKREGKNEKIN